MRMLPCLAAGLALALLAGCAAAPAKPTASDPLERMNRTTYAFNQAVDHAFLRPVAKGYDYFVPQPLRTGISNMLSNLGLPVVFVNDLLQWKPRAAGQDLGRLLVNSTFGLAGLLDPASGAGIPRNDEDFGQTFGRWGMSSGPYLVLPFFGPSSFRDAPGFAIEFVADPRTGLDNQALSNTLVGLTIVNRRAELLSTEKVLDEAYDPYAFIRNAWLQRRQFLVTDGATPEEEPLEDPEADMGDDEATAEPPAAPATTPPAEPATPPAAPAPTDVPPPP
jgi:phospholipid-binding lipoprotein MlaA